MGKKYQAPPKADPATLYRSAGYVTIHTAAVAFAERADLEVFAATTAEGLTQAICERLPHYAKSYSGLPAARPLLQQMDRLLHENTPQSRDAAIDLFFEEITAIQGGDDLGDRMTRKTQTLTVL